VAGLGLEVKKASFEGARSWFDRVTDANGQVVVSAAILLASASASRSTMPANSTNGALATICAQLEPQEPAPI
jgi:hypothetical protein